MSCSRRGRKPVYRSGLADERSFYAGILHVPSFGGARTSRSSLGTRDGAKRIIDIPLVLHLARILRPDGVHLLHHLVVVGAEIAFAALQDVELRALAQMLGELLRVGRLQSR